MATNQAQASLGKSIRLTVTYWAELPPMSEDELEQLVSSPGVAVPYSMMLLLPSSAPATPSQSLRPVMAALLVAQLLLVGEDGVLTLETLKEWSPSLAS